MARESARTDTTRRGRTFRRLIVLLLLLIGSGGAYAQAPAPDQAIVQTLHSTILGEDRTVHIYLPAGYKAGATDRYDVVYVIDGEMLLRFFPPVRAFAEENDLVPPLILVGIDNLYWYDKGLDSRDRDLLPAAVTGSPLSGGADRFSRFLVEELKPFIDRTYRTRPMAAATGIGGASLGGLVSLYLGLKYPDVFGTVFAVSPHVWWDHGVILKMVAALPKKPAQRIWVDVGTGEGEEYVDGVRRLRDALTAEGWKIGKELAYTEDEGAQHDELAWAARVEPMLRWAVATR